MGQIIIKIPLDKMLEFEIRDETRTRKLLEALAQIEERERDEEDDILSLWAAPKEFVNKKAV